MTQPRGKRVLSVALIMGSLTLHAAHAADPANGRRLAELWCTSCHIASPDQPRGSADAPAFSAIGRQPGFNAGQLTLFLLDPHPAMPNMGLTRTEAIDIASYIQSLAASH